MQSLTAAQAHRERQAGSTELLESTLLRFGDCGACPAGSMRMKCPYTGDQHLCLFGARHSVQDCCSGPCFCADQTIEQIPGCFEAWAYERQRKLGESILQQLTRCRRIGIVHKYSLE